MVLCGVDSIDADYIGVDLLQVRKVAFAAVAVGKRVSV